MSKFITLDEIVYALQRHPADCVFELNAPKKILARLSSQPRDYWFNSGSYLTTNYVRAKQRMQSFRDCFVASELYCPHEGVDRLQETDVSLNWRMS